MGLIFYSSCSNLHYLERCSIFRKDSITAAHLPSFMLLIGYPVYWLEVYFLKATGRSVTLLATAVFVLFCLSFFVYRLLNKSKNLYNVKQHLSKVDLLSRGFIFACVAVALGILAISFYASLLPPHLPQEFDALNYHITLPKQHLLAGSFEHFPWSSADLYLLPIQFSLAPYWLATELPNKFPQFIFLLGLLGVISRLTFRSSKRKYAGILLVVFAVLGSHGFGIQMGTAMLDIVLCYLFFAAIDSFLDGNFFMSACEFVFYFWAKPFFPIQNIFIVLGLVLFYFILSKFKFQASLSSKKEFAAGLKKVGLYFVLLSIFVAGPFIVKSIYYAGTPLYPIMPGMFKKPAMDLSQVIANANIHMNIKDQYGHGRSFWAFLKHFWLISVPEKGVNNSYDYPLGLPYLLCLGPFIFSFVEGLRKKKFFAAHFFVVLSWIAWWIGTHQTRFLFVPLLMMFIIVFSQERFNRKIVWISLGLSLFLVFISAYRAHKNDWFKNPYEVLREKDVELVEMRDEILDNQVVVLDRTDAAFADFSVYVIASPNVFIISK